MRTHKCGELNKDNLGEAVELCGWVHKRRDHGGVIFIDLRDREGLVQVVFNPETTDTFAIAESVRSEYVLRVEGVVRDRLEGTVNPNMATGEIEILVSHIEVLNESETPPFPIESEIEVNEEMRLRYRYIDLRKTAMLEKMKVRRDVTRHLRNFLDDQDFFEMETPILTKATPEGARDYIVPSRTHPNSFFALPQSPQLYKQLLMMSGMDKYYQVVRCFRDEDLRADRQPEFTQLDIETSFMNEDEIMTVMEEMVRQLFKDVIGVNLDEQFPTTVEAIDGEAALERVADREPDLIVLDVMLPKLDGYSVITELRKHTQVPVILLTARAEEVDRVLGLELGADDYVVKPFSPRELAARVRSVLRRTNTTEHTTESLDFDGLIIDGKTREVLVDGERVDMPPMEFDLLMYLASSPRQVFSRGQILDHVWGSSTDWQDPSTVTVHIRRLRQKIERDADAPERIETVWGRGYRFNP